MAKSESEKIAAAKAAAKNISNSTYKKGLNSGGAPSKVDKIIYNEVLRSEDTGRRTGASKQDVKGPGNSTISGNSGRDTVVTAENALARAAAVAAKTGEDVQTVRSRIKTDVAKTAMRASMMESKGTQKDHHVTKVDRKTGKSN